MNCRELQDWLQESLDQRRLAPTPAVREHVRECDSCRRDLSAARVLLGGVGSGFAANQSNALMTATIAAAVRADRQHRRRMTTYRWYATAALAASILLLFGFGALTPLAKTKNDVAKNDPPKASPKDLPKPAPETPEIELTQRADDAQKAVASLTKSVAERAKSRLSSLMPDAPAIDVGLPPSPIIEEPIDPAAESLRQAGQTVAHSLEPMTQTVVRAFDFFAREMPVLDFPKN